MNTLDVESRFLKNRTINAKRSKLTFLSVIISIIAFFSIAYLTNPTLEQHKKVVSDFITAHQDKHDGLCILSDKDINKYSISRNNFYIFSVTMFKFNTDKEFHNLPGFGMFGHITNLNLSLDSCVPMFQIENDDNGQIFMVILYLVILVFTAYLFAQLDFQIFRYPLGFIFMIAFNIFWIYFWVFA